MTPTIRSFAARLISAVRGTLNRYRTAVLVCFLTIFVVGLGVSIDQLEIGLSEISVVPLVVNLLIATPLAVALGSLSLWISVRIVGRHVTIGRATLATTIGAVSEVAPLPGSLIARGTVLVQSGASFRDAGRVLSMGAVLLLAMSALAAAIPLASEWPIAAAVIASISVVATVFVVRWVINFANVRLAIMFLMVRVFSVASLIFRIWLAYAMLNIDTGVMELALYSFAGTLGGIASIAPAGLGVREAAAAILAEMVSSSSAAAFTAMAITRVAGLLVCGVIAAASMGFWASRQGDVKA